MRFLLRFFRHKQLDQQLEKELAFHLEQHMADLIARGASPAEARRQARLALGGPQQVMEQCRDARGTRWLDDLAQDLRYALRTLRWKPGFASVAILTLALGIGATTVMFTVVNGVLLKPLAYPAPERLAALHVHSEHYGDEWGFSYPDFLDCRAASGSLDVAGWAYSGGTVSRPGEPEYVEGRQISADLFDVLGIPLLRGRAFRPEEDQPGAAPVAIISFSLWQQRYGGKPEAVGMPLALDGKQYTIVGIAPAGFQLNGEAGVFTPLGQVTEMRMRSRYAHFLRALARLRGDATLTGAQAELSLIARHLAEQYPASNAGLGMTLHPLRRELVEDVRPTLWLLLGAVSLLLLIACVNVASLLLARAVSRDRELAMRMALGASRGRLARQCLAESAVLGIAGGAFGVLIAMSGIRPFVTFWPGSLPRAGEIQLDWRVLLFALAVSLASSLLFGFAPALRASGRDLEQVLRSGTRTVTAGSRRLHSAYVIAEVAFTVVLLISAGILGRALLRLSSLDPGLNFRNVLTARVGLSPGALTNPGQTRAAWQDLLDRAGHVPGVESAALVDIVPMRAGVNTLNYSTTAIAPPPNQAPVALATTATPGYLKVMGIPLLQGRFFDDRERLGSAPVVVIDEVLAKHAFGQSQALGKRLWVPGFGPAPVEVIGVVGHVRNWGLADDDQSLVRDQCYYPFAQVPDALMRLFSSFMSVTVRTSIPPLQVTETLKRAVRGASGDQTLYEIHSMEQLVSGSLARQRFLLALFGVFAALALLLACIGIYGVLAYLTSQRIPEFGVRIALGATGRDVIRLVLGQSLPMIFAGVGAGTLAALATGRLLEHAVAGVHYAEPLTFAAMILVLVFAAAFASFLPARRASRTDPMRALRQE